MARPRPDAARPEGTPTPSRGITGLRLPSLQPPYRLAPGPGTAPTAWASTLTPAAPLSPAQAAAARLERRETRRHPLRATSRWWHSLPLTARLVYMTTLLLSTGLLVVSGVSTSVLSAQLTSQVDDQLRSTAQAVGSQALTRLDNGSTEAMPSTYFMEIRYTDGSRLPLISATTASVYGTPQVGDFTLKEVLALGSEQTLRTVDSNLLGRRWRVILMPVTDTSGQYIGAGAIGLPLGDVLSTVQRTRVVVALTSMLVILAGGLTALVLVRRSLRPLREIEKTAGRIARGELSARVPATEDAGTEVGSLQRSLNAMLVRNEHAFSVQQEAQVRNTRFVSDASHELRTPLAAIRGYGELYRMGGVPPEHTEEVMGRIESEATRMGRLVEDLLQLARMDEGRPLELERVDLTEVAAAVLTDMSVLAPERDCEVTSLDGGDAASTVVIGDRDKLSQVLTNLLGNITRYTPEGSPVEIAVGTQLVDDATGEAVKAARGNASAPADKGVSAHRRAVVEVRDHGPGVAPEDAARVFERFYRSDTSRNRETGGSGLGLAIVAAIVQTHGGSVRMGQTPGGGATVRIVLPLA